MEDGRIDDEDKGDHRWKDTRWALKDTNGLEGQRSSGLITCWVRVTKGGKSLWLVGRGAVLIYMRVAILHRKAQQHRKHCNTAMHSKQ